MPRIIATITDDTEKALIEMQRETKAPLAAHVRQALAEYLARHGKVVDADVQWGGQRKADTPAVRVLRSSPL